jgi:predicted nucleotidyltransferase
MDLLTQILSSRVKAAVFRLLFGLNPQRLHLRELARRSKLALGTVQQEVKRLESVHLIKSKADGNRTYYEANQEHPLYQEIHRLVLKTSGMVDVLRDALGNKDIEIAFVFGSVARGEETAASDVDLMVIGSVSLRELSKRLSGIADILGREINPHVFDRIEFLKRIKAKDHFVTRILSEPKFYVYGGDHEFAGLG